MNLRDDLLMQLVNLAEIADKHMPFYWHKPSNSSIDSDGNTKGSRFKKGFTYALGRKNDGSEESSNGVKPPNSSNRDEIVALFRRIQSSIAKAENQRAKTKSFNPSNEKSTTESIMDVLQKSGKNLQDTRTKKGAKALRRRSGIPKKRQGKDKAPAAMEEFNLSRSPSNFKNRSPIPYPTSPRTKTPEWNIESMSTDKGSELANIEKLKDFNLSRLPSNFMKKSPILHPTAPRTRTPEENFEAVSTAEGSAANIEKLKLSEMK
ncbi:Ribosomal protein large subunit 16A [Hibiscus syriacus]|uniref:Ribosomal protein large subunit 16A n=1 Tax=Hibiscus syriacus TaxID=106335 RepID=A0A6A3BGL2_HIBSY|nr:Ribosomal protein large subunit 16A [Hibiscus syriacus]